MNILDDLQARGLLDRCSDEAALRKMLDHKQTIYCGFDPSATSMQLGNFVMVTMLRRLQLAGHRIIAVIGGGTGMIGDPSGKNAERSFLAGDTVKNNVKCLTKQLQKYLDFSTPDKGIIIDNFEWWNNISVIEYLRDYGKYFQINYMLAKDIVKSRLDTGISYAEFSYMILQSGDFLNLYKAHDCHIQCGGGDQWGNLTSSLDFVRRSLGEEAEAEVFTLKLITDSQGKKFGKSENGALYLDSSMTSPYRIYQYFINTDDESVEKFLRIFDLRPLTEISKIAQKHLENPGLRFGQRELARIMVTTLHGADKAAECEKMSTALFKDEFIGLSPSAMKELASSLPNIERQDELVLIQALIDTKLASSRREAREFLNSGSIRVNGKVVKDENFLLEKGTGTDAKFYFVKRGKKNYAAVIIN